MPQTCEKNTQKTPTLLYQQEFEIHIDHGFLSTEKKCVFSNYIAQD